MSSLNEQGEANEDSISDSLYSSCDVHSHATRSLEELLVGAYPTEVESS